MTYVRQKTTADCGEEDELEAMMRELESIAEESAEEEELTEEAYEEEMIGEELKKHSECINETHYLNRE